MKYCKKCGAQMKDDARFCPSCGAGGEAGSPAKEPAQKPAGHTGGKLPEEGKKKSAVPFIIICLVLVVAMAGGTAYFVWSRGRDKGTVAQAEDSDGGWGKDDGDREEKEKKETAEEETPVAETSAPEPETTAVAAETTVALPAETAAPEGDGSPAYNEPAETAASGDILEPGELNYTTMYVVNCDEFITLRPGDSTTSGEICKIPLGASVSYVATAGNGFYQVIYNGQVGYALASYLSENPESAAGSVPGYDTMYVVNCKEFITLRTSDSTSASEICKIPLGSSVSFVSVAGNGFYKIVYDGHTGYALASYLSY